MKVLIEALIPLLLVGLLVVLILKQLRLSERERGELANLRTFKHKVHQHALNEVEIESASPLGRQILAEVHDVERANNSGKELS